MQASKLMLATAAAAALVVAASPALAGAQSSATSIAALQKRVSDLRLKVERARAYDDLENLGSVYSFYLDKNLWNQLADLFSPTQGSVELAQRGVYKGERVRPGLISTFGQGGDGPGINRLGDHQNVQPVITVSPDAKTANVRIRLIQTMGNAGGSAMWGGGVYENTFVKENGVWKYAIDHVHNTYTMSYDGGPTKATGAGNLPGPNTRFPPDTGPTLVFKSFPFVYDLPIHYKNPVTGK